MMCRQARRQRFNLHAQRFRFLRRRMPDSQSSSCGQVQERDRIGGQPIALRMLRLNRPDHLIPTETRSPSLNRPPGRTRKAQQTVLLTVTDPRGATAQCTATVTVVDVTAPVVTCNISTSQLWPPNHNLINVGLSASATDNCDSSLTLVVRVFGD